MALYESDATLIPQPGQVVTGTEDIREALSGFLALNPKFDLDFKKAFQAGDIALLFSEWTLSGTDPDGNAIEVSGQTSDVVRRQPDGTWIFVLGADPSAPSTASANPSRSGESRLPHWGEQDRKVGSREVD